MFRWKSLLVALILAGLASGCAHPISSSLRDQANPDFSLERIMQRPEHFKGEKVVLGGIIVQTRNYNGWSEVEIIQVPLTWTGRLGDRDESSGRVILRYEGFLEPEIYSKDREVTVGGTVTGVKTGTIDKAEYKYVVVKVEELRLWEKSEYVYYGYPYYGYWGYWGPYYSPAWSYRRGPFYW
ncbi:outer membrane lipoprotein [Nitrospina gracilis Nb-211]|nr:outer membrane lipoprotein [Nitrospina gracilis Nb-211]